MIARPGTVDLKGTRRAHALQTASDHGVLRRTSVRREARGRASGGSMARHYATRDFFRQMPNPLLARYFHARGVFADLDIAAMPEPQSESCGRPG